jgi:hypothetical protein
LVGAVTAAAGTHLSVLDECVNDALHVADAVLHVGRRLDNTRKHLLVLRVEIRVRVLLLFVIEGAEAAVGVLLVRAWMPASLERRPHLSKHMPRNGSE